MKNLIVKLTVIASLSAAASAGLGVGSSLAQNQVQLCPEGQTYEFVFECNRETRQCVLVWEGCV